MPLRSIKSNAISIPSPIVSSITLPIVAADQALPSIVIPAYRGSLIAAYLSYHADWIYQNVAASVSDGNQNIQIDNSDGSGYHNAILIPTFSLRSFGGAVWGTCPVDIQGAIDIKAYCQPGVTLAIKWAAASMDAQSQIHNDVSLTVTLIFA